MSRQLRKAIISVFLIGSILCSFEFWKSFDQNVPQNYQPVEILVDPDEDSFSLVVADNFVNSISIFIPFFPGEEFDPENENEDHKTNSFQGSSTCGELLLQQVNAPPFNFNSSLVAKLSRLPLYLVFEVFII